MPYASEIKALTQANRLRKRQVFSPDLHDFASNDYLGLAHRRRSFELAYRRVKQSPPYGPKASQLVNGYHLLHRELEETLCHLHGCESALLVGSGFLANLALFESLVRRNDLLLVDSEYHASGQMALKTVTGKVERFAHNDPDDLCKKIRNAEARRIIIAIEGVYSMSGEKARPEIVRIAAESDAILLVDEAHSGGTIGENLLGYFDDPDVARPAQMIKMGTLGKAYGSYGAYILASSSIIRYLENRAKPIVYSTALSPMDAALGLVNLLEVQTNLQCYRKKVRQRRELAQKLLQRPIDSLIVPIPIGSASVAMQWQQQLGNQGFLVGAIRPPTVEASQLRVILRTAQSMKNTRNLLQHLLQSHP